MVFTVTQNNLGIDLLNKLLGNTAGLSNFNVRLTGDGRAFGTFDNDPFNLQSGVVLSTGRVVDLTGVNTADGGFSPGVSVPLTFTKLPGTAGSPPFGTTVFVADLSTVGIDVNSIAIADSGSGAGGSPGKFSGFDLDAIKVSPVLVSTAAEVNALPSFNVFDFSPAGTVLTPGTQRATEDPNLISPDLKGTLNGTINNGEATLSQFDSTGSTGAPFFGAASLGDGGRVGFDLTSSLATGGSPLYLYIGEAGVSAEEAPAGAITVSDRPISGLNDLSTDFGIPGEDNDTISMEIEFDAAPTASQVFFQFVFGSEELVEYGGLFNDAFSLELNGVNLATLNDGAEVTINNLVPSPFVGYHPDFIYNPVGTDAVTDQTRLDGFTKTLTFVGDLEQSIRNTLTITLKDTRDGLFDSAVFLRAGTLSVDPPTTVIDPGGGQNTIDIPTGGGTVVIDNFGGVGRGSAPTPETIAEVDTLRFTGAQLTARNLILTQNGTNLELTFEGVSNTKVVLRNFNQENLDNLRQSSGATVDLGNVLFDGQSAIEDNFDVFNSEWTFNRLLNANSVTFLNELNNNIRGSDLNDVINGQGGADIIKGDKGDDLLRGGNGIDNLQGEAGNDILVGGADADVLRGGAGSDRFVISAGAGTDTIADYKVGIDTIGLANGLSFDDLSIVQGSGANIKDTVISQIGTGEVLVILTNLKANTITPIDFVPV